MAYSRQIMDATDRQSLSDTGELAWIEAQADALRAGDLLAAMHPKAVKLKPAEAGAERPALPHAARTVHDLLTFDTTEP